MQKKQLANLLYVLFIRLLSLGFRLAAPFNIKARLGVQGRNNIFSKIKINNKIPGEPVVWMHCASLGEFEQGRPVLEALKLKYPNTKFVLTFFSASGFEAMKHYKVADEIYYLPMDSPSNAKKMVTVLKPSLVLWVKYEFWFYYLEQFKQAKIPVLLISGIFRTNQPFFKWYGGIWREMLGYFNHLFVQNESSKDLLSTLGFHENVSVAGDTRFDRVIEIAQQFEPLPVIEKFCKNHRILVAGSTWDEDEIILSHYIKANPQIRFVIAPHEIDAGNLQDVRQTFDGAVFYSEVSGKEDRLNENEISSNVLVIDNVGMLSRLYHYADIAYVGGGFGGDGVHNVLEPAVYGKPVFYGPEFERYAEAVGLIECGGAITIKNALELERKMNELWQNEPLLSETGKASKDFVYAQAGSTEKIIQFIQEKRLLTN